MVVVNCEQVWQEISNYIDNDVDPSLRSAVDEHLHQCQRCTAVLEGTRNVVELYGDDRLFHVPMGYSWRLQRRLAGNMPNRRSFLGWAFATAAVAVIGASIAYENSKPDPTLAMKSEHANPGRVPPQLAVVITDHGKLFHVHGCPFLKENDNARNVTAAEAMKDGYVPCVRCLGEYVNAIAQSVSKRMLGAVQT
jgi:hypothetical protein